MFPLYYNHLDIPLEILSHCDKDFRDDLGKRLLLFNSPFVHRSGQFDLEIFNLIVSHNHHVCGLRADFGHSGGEERMKPDETAKSAHAFSCS